MEESESYHKITQESEDVYSTDYGWDLYKDDDNSSAKSSKYRRTYTWNERNQLISSVDSSYSTAYVYGQDGQRSNKYTASSETLYFNKMWTLHTDSGNSVYGGQTAKNIYLGETRIVTKLNGANDPTYQEEYYKQYFYHSDHLGSASLISDYNGDEYQRIEYTPYGETWVEKTQNSGMEYLPYKFTAKELDEETGLYYYGARYLDPKYSRWLSADPALGEYIPQAPVSDEAKRHNQNLPGMGGVFNSVNLNLYHYAANNPVKYTDPDGRTAYAMKTGNDYWRYDCSNGIFWDLGRAGVNLGLDFLPPLFGLALKVGNIGLGKLIGMEVINDCANWVDDFASEFGSALGNLSYMEVAGSFAEKIMKHSNDITDFLKTEGEIFGHLSTACDVASLFLVFSHKNEIELDQVIKKLVGSELTSSSKEGLIGKYNYAKGRIQEMIDDRAVGYQSDWKWRVTDVRYNGERLKSLQQELKNME